MIDEIGVLLPPLDNRSISQTLMLHSIHFKYGNTHKHGQHNSLNKHQIKRAVIRTLFCTIR